MLIGIIGPKEVESTTGAVVVGLSQLLPPLSFGGASIDSPRLRFQSPLIEPDRQISRTKWARAHLVRNVANSQMWRSSRKSLLLR